MATALPAIYVDEQPQVTPPAPIAGAIAPAQASQQPEFNIGPITGPTEEPFQVDTSSLNVAPPSSQDTLNSRSAKVKYGLDEVLKKTKDEIFTNLAQGDEPALRAQAAAEIDKRKSAALDSLITETIKRKGSDLTAEEAGGLTSIVMAMSAKTDPETVFEEGYAKQFIATLDRVAAQKPDSFLNDAKQQHPEETAAIMNKYVNHSTKREVLQTYLEDVEDDLKNQGWLGWGADQAKFMVPGYQDIQQRGNISGVGVFSGVGLGENLENQSIALWRLPIEKMKEEIRRVVEPMRRGNPTLASHFLRSMLGMSDDDVVLGNVALPIDLAGLGLGKAAVKGVRALLPKSQTQILKDTEEAARQMARASANPSISKSGIESAAGDLEQAAITQETSNIYGETKGLVDPTKRGLESLSAAFRTDVADVKARPGRFGQEIVNRIEEQTNTIIPEVMSVAEKISKVERLPEVMSNELAVRTIIDGIKDKYVGLRNTVIDTTAPYRENLAGNWFVDFHLGNADGTYFTQRSVAENFIKHHGLTSGEVVEGTSVLKTKAGKKQTSIENQIQNAQSTITKIEKRLSDDAYSTPEKRVRDQDTLEFLKTEAIPGYKAKLETARGQRVTVEQQGLGFYVKITKPVAETDDVVRNVIASTTNTQIPSNTISSFFNAWGVGRYRTPEDTLSRAERANRLVATYTPSEIFGVLAKASPTLNKIATAKPARFSKGRQKWDEFQRFLEQGQELWDVETKQKGYFFKSPAEIEESYLSLFKRLPDKDEIVAYFEFKRGMEIDRMFRNVAEHRNQTRVGAETTKIISADADGKAIATPEFSAVPRTKLGGGSHNVAIIGEKHGFEKVRDIGNMTTKEKGEFQDLLDSGEWQHYEIYNPDLRPLKGYGNIGDERIRYVLAKTTETRELDWNHIPRRGGGHVEHDHAYYIKQGKVKEDPVSGQNWYEGDTTIMPMQVHAMAQDVAGKLDTVRKYLLDKNETAARDYSNANLHIEWKEVESWFKGEKMPTGEWRGARLSLKEPIQVVKRNESIVGVDNSLEKRYANFRNGNKEGNLARQNKVQFSEERDAFDTFTLENKGTAQNPLYNVAQADKVDPITSLNRGLTRIAKSNFMDDYKTMSVEHWLQQAKNYLQASESEIRHSPFYWFEEAKFLPDAPPLIQAQLETARAHTKQLIGQPSETAAKLHALSQQMADATYNKFGDKSPLVPEWDLAKITDPISFMRTIVYHYAMGLWNIPQFIVQSGNYSNILGIAGPRYATSGTLGAQLHFWSRANSRPQTIDFLDNLASKFQIPGVANWKPGEFKEGFEEFKKTGFGNVGGEFAAIDDPMATAKIVGSAGQTFLDSSTFFVRNGERNSRYGAWYTAFKEFRDKNPTGRITEQDRSDILQRADLLNINMSRASSSAMHSGAMSIPTQFYTYQIRLTELMASGRLSNEEKWRMFYTNSLLYGIPMGLGISGIPFSGFIREKMAERGYVVGDNFFSSTAMEGLVSAIGAIATGKGDPSAGTWFDVGERFGTKGFEFLGGINRSDKNFLDIIGGPAWSLIKGTVEQSDGFWRVMGNLIREDGDLFQPDVADFIDPLKQIGTVNSIFRTLGAIHNGRWLSKNESWLADDIGAKEAITTFLTGLKDQRINDIQTFRNALSHQKEYEKEIEKMFLQEYRRGVLATKDNNEELSKKFFSRAKVILQRFGYPEDQYSTLLNRAAQENKSVLDRVTFDFYRKRPNNEQKDVGTDALRRSEDVKRKKRGED